MTTYNNNPYNNYSQPAYAEPEGAELFDGAEVSAADLGDYDKPYTLLPEGDYPFTVVNISSKRYQPGPNSTGKTGPCKQIILTLRVMDPSNGAAVDLTHNLYMWNSRANLGMIAQFYDSVGMHKKGEPIRFDWRPEVLIGKTGKLALNHKIHKDDTNKPADQQRRYNNVSKLYAKEETAGNPVQTGGFVPGKF
jgi:hypothetical protein